MIFMDESGFLLVPEITRSWAPRGKTPLIKTAGTWKKVSAISALVVSASYRHMRLLYRFHVANVKLSEVTAFLRYLLERVRGKILLIWDRLPMHQAKLIKRFLLKHPRLKVSLLPPYAPELNPDEYVWTYVKAALANRLAEDTRELMRFLHGPLKRLQRSQHLLWSRIHLSQLPWSRGRRGVSNIS